MEWNDLNVSLFFIFLQLMGLNHRPHKSVENELSVWSSRVANYFSFPRVFPVLRSTMVRSIAGALFLKEMKYLQGSISFCDHVRRTLARHRQNLCSQGTNCKTRITQQDQSTSKTATTMESPCKQQGIFSVTCQEELQSKNRLPNLTSRSINHSA